MRVLHLIKTSQGAAWAFRQINVLKNLGVEVHVLVPSMQGDLIERLKSIDVKLHEFDVNLPKNILSLVKGIKKFNQLVDEIKPDLIHSHFVSSTYFMRLALRKKDIPRIFQVPGPLHLENKPYDFIDIKLAQDNDYWIGTCEWTKNKYLELGIESKKVFLSYYGSDLSALTNNEPGYLRKELGLSNEIPIVGMVAYMYAPKRYLGQFRGLKGHEDFIKAFVSVKKKFPNVKGVIVGGPWGNNRKYEIRLKKLAYKYCGDSIIFLGFRKDVPKIYPDFNVAVHPSLSENVGGAVESLLSEIPTITTNVGGFPDVIKDDITGWLVETKNPQMLSEKIISVLENSKLAKIKAIKGNELVKSLLNVEDNAKEIYDIYKVILKEKNISEPL